MGRRGRIWPATNKRFFAALRMINCVLRLSLSHNGLWVRCTTTLFGRILRFISGFRLVGFGYLLWLQLINSCQTIDGFTLKGKENIFYVLQNVKHILSDVNFFLIFLKKFGRFLFPVVLCRTPTRKRPTSYFSFVLKFSWNLLQGVADGCFWHKSSGSISI